MANKRKKKRVLNARVVWLLLVVISIIFFISFVRMPMFPIRWSIMVLIGLLIMLAFTLFLATVAYKNLFVKIFEFVLCIVLAVGSVIMPRIESQITNLFNGATGNGTVIGFYVVNAEYKQNHSDVFSSSEVSEDIQDYADSVFITSIAVDSTNQNYALQQVQTDLGQNVSVIDRSTLLAAVDSLYNNEGQVMLLSNTMLSMITETEGYEDFEDNVTMITSYTKEVETEVEKTDVSLTTQPFCIFFGGNDEEGDLYTEGRTDVDMLVTVNPNSHQIAIVSFPRDSYVANPYYSQYDGYDKLTHLGLAGISNTLAGLNQVLGLDIINNYVIINFTTYRQIIDAIGGVDVENDIEFTALDNEYFPQGTIHLEGEYALMYVRERYAFVDGDFERNYHQQIVMKAMIQKLCSPEIIVHFDTLLSSLQGTFMTNISSESIYALCKKQLDENISWNIVNYHVTGDASGYAYCCAEGDYRSVVYPYDNQIEFVSNVMKSVINGDIVTQEELPEGEFYSSNTNTNDYYNSDTYYNADDSYNGYNSYEDNNYYDDNYYEDNSYYDENNGYEENNDDSTFNENTDFNYVYGDYGN